MSRPAYAPYPPLHRRPPTIPVHSAVTLWRRSLVSEALHSALTIYHSSLNLPRYIRSGAEFRAGPKGWQLDVADPWAALARALITMSIEGHWAAERQGCSSVEDQRLNGRIEKAQRVLLQIMPKIVALAEDKSYLCKESHRGHIAHFRQLWPDIDPGHRELDLVQQSHISSLTIALEYAPIIALRLIHHALFNSKDDSLDFSRLGVACSDLNEVPVSALCYLFGLEPGEVKKLQVSYNTWQSAPSWLATAFPNLVSLDLTSTAPLDHLPLSLLWLPLASVNVQGGTKMDDPQGPIIRSIADTDTHAAKVGPVGYQLGPPSLQHILHGVYDTALRKHYPPASLVYTPKHLVDLMAGTYRCELCSRSVSPDQETWVEEAIERAWALQVEQDDSRIRRRNPGIKPDPITWVPKQLVRVKGRACKQCVARYLMPSDDVWSIWARKAPR